MYAVGIDVGSLTTKAAIMKDGEIISLVVTSTGDEVDMSARKAVGEAYSSAGLPETNDRYIVTTGAGGKSVSFSDRSKSITTCLARGILRSVPSARAVIDIGAESCTVIKLSERGKVFDWANHDKCAAGTGLFLQQMAKLMKLSLEEMSVMSAEAKTGAEISGTCAVFAESEVISHVHRVPPTPIPEIILGIYLSVTGRIKTMCKRIGIIGDIAVTGGASLNKGLVNTLSRELNTEIKIPEDPVCVAAIGAAVLADEEIQKEGSG